MDAWRATNLEDPDELADIWGYYKPRHTHAWNMLALAFRDLEQKSPVAPGFEIEYAWENLILRLWLYRAVVRTLTKLPAVRDRARLVLESFDQEFDHSGVNGLKALRDMVEHFDDYAADQGRGPAQRSSDLDPWRTFTRDEYKRGQFILNRSATLQAASQMRSNAKLVSDEFITWYREQ